MLTGFHYNLRDLPVTLLRMPTLPNACRPLLTCLSLLLSVVLTLLSAQVAAQSAPGPLQFERVTASSGLNAPFITSIAQDGQGYMWFGTKQGMIRYDGYKSRQFKNCSADSGDTGGENVYSMVRDSKDRFWIATARGLCRYDPIHDKLIRFLNPPDEPAGNAVLKAIDDGAGNLWLVTRRGLVHFYPDNAHSDLIPFDDVTMQALRRKPDAALVRDAAGYLWFGCDAGLYRLAPSAEVLVPIPIATQRAADDPAQRITSLHIDQRHVLWIGTGMGLASLSIVNPQLPLASSELLQQSAQLRITDMLEDSQGNLWLGTQNEGLLHWDRTSGQVSVYRHESSNAQSVAGDEIAAMFQDRTGTMWIATPIDGVSKVELNSGDFRRVSLDTRLGNELADNKIAAIFNGPNQMLWLGALGGTISSYDPKSGQIKRLSGLPGAVDIADKYNSITFKHFALDGHDGAWVVKPGGIHHVNLTGNEFERPAPSAGAPENGSIISIDIGADGALWALTSDHVYRLRRNATTWHVVSFAPELAGKMPLGARANDTLKALIVDQQGLVWVASNRKIYQLARESDELREFCDRPHSTGPGNGALMVVMYRDSHGDLWIDNESGVSHIVINNNQVLSVDSFDTSAMVDAFVEDRMGTLWISSDDGILRYDSRTSSMRHFNSQIDESVEGYFFYSGQIGNDGTIYFGGPHGMTAFRPDQISYAIRPAPQVLITDLQIFNRSVSMTQTNDEEVLAGSIQTRSEIELPYHASVFSFEFAAMDFASPGENRFAYQLQGFDPDWRYTDASSRLATYTNLAPGHYTFRVRAANSDGVWNNIGAHLEITIRPPFWRTWWFATLLIAALLASLVGAYRVRVRGLLRQQRALELLVGQRTQEIVRQKDVIEVKNRQLEAINQLQEEHQSELTHFLAVASHDLRQPIHALNIYLGALTDMDIGASARAIFDKMNRCVQIMDEMFLSLLDLSLLEAHAVKPRIEHFSIGTILSLIEVEFSPQASAAGLTLNIDHCTDWIRSDANLIKQIIANLTANAIRYTKSGTITITCARLGPQLRVAVQDTGIGISPSQQSVVFKRFHQLGNADREKSKGIGLGLAIVKRLCELLSLPLSLSSVPGQGSTFAIDLPLSGSDAPQITNAIAAGQFASQISLSNVLAVVIDDDPIILDAMRGLLEKWGCAVTTASTGAEAIAILGTSSRMPDVLICDYRLHVSDDGIDTINMLRNEFNQEIPALLITGDTSSDIIGSLDASTISVMHKPLRAEALRDTLVRLLYPESVFVPGTQGNGEN